MLRRSFFATAASGLAWMLGARPAALSSIAYADHELCRKVSMWFDVTCDGQPVKWCRAANASEGWAEVYTPDAQGRKHVISGTNEVATHRIYGLVVIGGRPWTDSDKEFYEYDRAYKARSKPCES